MLSNFIQSDLMSSNKSVGSCVGLKMALSDAKLKSMLKGHDDKTPRKIADRDGLSVLWRNTGKVSFMYRYRFLGKQQNVTLGTYTGTDTGMSLADARRKADQCRAWLEEGRNPSNALKFIKDERQRPVTVRDALEYWLTNYADEKHVNTRQHRMQLNKWVYPRIGDLSLADCETHHWLDVFDAYRKSAPVACGYCFQICKQALKYCRVRRYAISNALDDLTINDVGKKQGKRDRILTPAEIRDIWIWAKSQSSHSYYANLVILLLSFGARTQELRLSEINEWDLNSFIWVVPAKNSKTKKKITRPIPEQCRSLIMDMIEQAKSLNSSYLLGELKSPEAVSQYGRMLWKNFEHSEAWTLHDLRRSFATHLNNEGVAPHVVEIILGHALQGAMAHYIHTDRLPEQKQALELWQTVIATWCNVDEK